MVEHSRAESWDDYLQQFHAERAGITERVLRRCLVDGRDPYQWCAEALTGGGPILDLACGSGPMADHAPRWVGVDRSAPELTAAQAQGRRPLVRAGAAGLPFRSGSVPGAICTMSLQVLEPLVSALGELARVLAPGAQVVALLPAGGPLGWRDTLAYTRLQVALRARIAYPNDPQLRPPALAATLAQLRLRIVTDQRLAFGLPLRSHDDVATLVTSLYLPEVGAARLAAARRALGHRIGTDLAVPLRRLVLESTKPTGGTGSQRP